MQKKVWTLVRYLLALLITLIALVPFIVLLQMALNLPSSMVGKTIWRIPDFTTQNIVTAWTKSKLGQAMVNSVIITGVSVTGIVLVASSAAYQIARFRSRATFVFSNLLVFSMAIPSIVSTVPLYLLMRGLSAINTRWGMILLNITFNLPFAVFLMTNFIRGINVSMEEAAIIDGCTCFSAFYRVLLPMLKPIVTTVILLNAVSIWNEYGRSVFFLQKSKLYTVPLRISMFMQQYTASWELMAAGALVGMLPPVVIFLSFQKYFIKGMTAGAVKG